MSTQPQVLWDDEQQEKTPGIKWDDESATPIPGDPNAIPKPKINMQESSLGHVLTGSPLTGMESGLPSPAQDPATASEMSRDAAIGSFITNPVATAGALGAGYLGGKGARLGAGALGAGERGQDIAEGVGNLVGGVAGGHLAPRVPGMIGNALREPGYTPFKPNPLKPGVKAIANLGKMVGGPEMAEALIPERTSGRPGLFSKLPSKMPKAPTVESPLGSAENPGWHSKLPTRMPQLPAPTPELGSPENPGWHAKLPTRMPALPAPSEFKSPYEIRAAGPEVPRGGLPQLPEGGTNAGPKPNTPLVASPEDWNSYEQRMKILGQEAKDAGTYHAARGATSRKLDLQQRIGKKISQ